jgi:hypothetical protein
MRALSPDFFVFNGDQIYGDNTCSAKGPSNVTGWTNKEGNLPNVTDNKVNWPSQTQLQDVYNKHWEYNEPIHICKAPCAIHLCTLKLTIMKL